MASEAIADGPLKQESAHDRIGDWISLIKMEEDDSQQLRHARLKTLSASGLSLFKGLDFAKV